MSSKAKARHKTAFNAGAGLSAKQAEDLDIGELLRLQRIVIGDARFVHLGLRVEGGFVGEHNRDSRMPLPQHISARQETTLHSWKA